MKSQLLKLAVCALLFAPIILCQNSPLPNGVNQHDGFFLRYTVGGGYSQWNSDLDGEDFVNYKGGVPITSRLQIGGAVSENVIIFGESGGTFMLSPELEIRGSKVEDTDLYVYMGGVGPGITYYFMPVNIYVSGSILFAFSAIGRGGAADGASGFGFNLMAGKEWWTGEQVGLGVSIYYYYSSLTDPDVTQVSINSYSVGLLFSITYN